MCLRIQTSPIANTLSVKMTKKGIDFKFTGSTFLLHKRTLARRFIRLIFETKIRY